MYRVHSDVLTLRFALLRFALLCVRQFWHKLHSQTADLPHALPACVLHHRNSYLCCFDEHVSQCWCDLRIALYHRCLEFCVNRHDEITIYFKDTYHNHSGVKLIGPPTAVQ
jgi:hypothetical protein